MTRGVPCAVRDGRALMPRLLPLPLPKQMAQSDSSPGGFPTWNAAFAPSVKLRGVQGRLEIVTLRAEPTPTGAGES